MNPIQGMLIVAATYAMAAIIIVTIGPVIDEWADMADTEFHIDEHYPRAFESITNLRLWFYAAIIGACAIITIWQYFVVIATVQYRRLEGQTTANYNPYFGNFARRKNR